MVGKFLKLLLRLLGSKLKNLATMTIELIHSFKAFGIVPPFSFNSTETSAQKREVKLKFFAQVKSLSHSLCMFVMWQKALHCASFTLCMYVCLTSNVQPNSMKVFMHLYTIPTSDTHFKPTPVLKQPAM